MLATTHICFLWDLEFFHSFSQAPLPTIWLPVHCVVGLYSNLTQLPWLFLLLWADTAISSLPALGLVFDLSYNCPQASVCVHSQILLPRRLRTPGGDPSFPFSLCCALGSQPLRKHQQAPSLCLQVTSVSEEIQQIRGRAGKSRLLMLLASPLLYITRISCDPPPQPTPGPSTAPACSRQLSSGLCNCSHPPPSTGP